MQALILYDGHCALCSGAVQSILRLDDEGVFRFAPLQSIDSGKLEQDAPALAAFAKTQLDAAAVDPSKLDSIIVVDQHGTYQKSTAFFRIMRLLGWPYRTLTIFSLLPLRLRDGMYDWVARNRYRMFGKHDTCWLPKQEWRGRFVGE